MPSAVVAVHARTAIGAIIAGGADWWTSMDSGWVEAGNAGDTGFPGIGRASPPAPVAQYASRLRRRGNAFSQSNRAIDPRDRSG